MNQLSLFDKPDSLTPEAQADFDTRHMARTGDPASSKRAAAEITASGKARQQRQHVIDLVFQHPGKTSRELSELSSQLDRHQVARRLSEVEREGEIHRKTDGAKELTWWPRGEPM